MQRCLIVDDSRAFLSSARALLESQGMPVTACALSGEEALAIAKRAKPDLALVDVELAGEDGFILARSLIAQDPTLRVVIVSAHEFEDRYGIVLPLLAIAAESCMEPSRPEGCPDPAQGVSATNPCCDRATDPSAPGI